MNSLGLVIDAGVVIRRKKESESVQQLLTGTGTDVPFTFDFNGTDQFVALVFANSNPNITPNGDIGATAVLDNLTVTASAVPEPSSLALLAAGFGMIGLRRRRLK